MIGLGHPVALWGLLLVPVLVLAYAVDGQVRRRLLERVGHLPQVRRMTESLSTARRRWRAVLVTLAVGFLVVSLASPEISGTAHLAPRRGLDLVVALDFSRSMLASDVYPTRLDRAKRELDQLIDGLKGDRVGLVAFAGVTMSYPLTNDYQAAKLFWRDLGPDDIPVGGTNLAQALRESIDLLDRARDRRPREGVKPPAQVIVLLTDGDDTEGGSLEVARQAAQKGIIIYAVGIGTTSGEFVSLPKRGGGVEYVAENGQPVRMRLDSDALQKMASATGGDFFQVDPQRFGVDRVQRAIAALERNEEEGRVVRDADPAYPLALVPALILLVIEGLLGERRRTRFVPPPPPRVSRRVSGRAGGATLAPLALILLLPALTGFDLFQRPQPDVELGNRLLGEGKVADALAAYERALAAAPDDAAIHYDRGAALYALGRLPEARAEFERASQRGTDPSLRADALYNLGNAWMKQERPHDAVDAYKRALGLRPDDRRAKWNLEMALRRLLEEQKQKPPPQQQQAQQQQAQQQQAQQQQAQQQQAQQQQAQQQQAQQQQAQQQQAQQQQAQQQQAQQQQAQQQQANAEPPQTKQTGEAGKQGEEPPKARATEQKRDEREGPTDEERAAAERREGLAHDKREPREAKEIDRQDAEAVLDAFERVEPTVQKDLAKRKAAGARRPRRDW